MGIDVAPCVPVDSSGVFGRGGRLQGSRAADCEWVTHPAWILARPTAVQRKNRSSWEITDGAGGTKRAERGERDKREDKRGRRKAPLSRLGVAERWREDSAKGYRRAEPEEGLSRVTQERPGLQSICGDLLFFSNLRTHFHQAEFGQLILVLSQFFFSFFLSIILGN